MKNILVLGAGFVAEPVVEYLSRRSENQITLANYVLAEAKNLASKFSGVKAIQLDVANQDEVKKQLKGFDLAVSLVPAPFHAAIAKACIATKVSMVTASYESDEMRALAKEAKDADITILNEIGLDPGIDHLSAMQIIDKAHEKGESIDCFVSWCGGLPAPEFNDNPLGYKFSWAPKAVLMALLNEAKYLHQNKAVEVSSDQLMDWTQPLEVSGLKLEGYPNRESISYKEVYGIEESSTLLRGTLRYQGFSEIIKGAHQLKLLSTETIETADNMDWLEFLKLLNANKKLDKLLLNLSVKAKEALTWLGCFSHTKISKKSTPLDIFCDLLVEKLQYLNNESDMVVLQHKFVITKASGEEYFISSTLKVIGDPNGYSAMSKTVGYPVAIASQLILDGAFKKAGLQLPVSKELYQPMLKCLKDEGIDCVEKEYTIGEKSRKGFLSELYSVNLKR